MTRTIAKPRSAEIYDLAVELGMKGNSAREIQGLLPRMYEIGTIKVWLSHARQAGIPVPRAKPNRIHDARPVRPKAEVVHVVLSGAEEEQLRDLARRNVGITSIAATMRKPYSVVIAALDRLGLTRAGVRAG